MVLANLWAHSSPQIATRTMLPNEVFALACRAYYEEQGLIVDEKNGEFAHSPFTKKECNTGYYLLHEHHQQQGLLQSKDLDKCCFFIGDAKQWLQGCDYFPENYFELWDIYEKYSSEHTKSAGRIGISATHAEKDKFGRSIQGVKNAERLHAEKNEFGKSVQGVKNAERMNTVLHAEKDEFGRSVTAMKTNTQLWESTIDGFRSTAGPVALHNRSNGWDPNARVKIA